MYFEAYQRIYDIIKLPDGSACFGAFALWGPGKTAKVQCDAAAEAILARVEPYRIRSCREIPEVGR